MAKKKLNAELLIKAGQEAKLTNNANEFSHAKIDNETFMSVDIDKIDNNPLQPRIHINKEDLKLLVNSIKLHGLIQPISLVKTKSGRFILKAGQRRLLAHKELKLKKIKAVVEDEIDTDSELGKQKLFSIAVLENMQRENLVPLELSLALHQALSHKLYRNKQELARALSKSNSYISKLMNITKLEDEIIEDLRINKSTNDVEALYELQKIEDPKKQVELYFKFINREIDREYLRALNKKKKEDPKKQYNLSIKPKSIKLIIDTRNLPKDIKEALKKDLEYLTKKYIDIS